MGTRGLSSYGKKSVGNHFVCFVCLYHVRSSDECLVGWGCYRTVDGLLVIGQVV